MTFCGLMCVQMYLGLHHDVLYLRQCSELQDAAQLDPAAHRAVRAVAGMKASSLETFDLTGVAHRNNHTGPDAAGPAVSAGSAAPPVAYPLCSFKRYRA